MTLNTARPNHIAKVDPVWNQVRSEAEEIARTEPMMASLVHAVILRHKSFESALAYRLTQKLTSPDMRDSAIGDLIAEVMDGHPEIADAARADLMAVFERDPACHTLVQPLLFFKGFQAVEAYRVAHGLWQDERPELAYFVQMRVSEQFGVDIHPAARIGKGLMIDHAHSIVIGETAVVGDNVSMLHSVTLGGTGKEGHERHPKIGDGVLIGAGAAILGDIKIGCCSRIAAGSVVLKPVPVGVTVAGVPAKIVGKAGCENPSLSMNQVLGEDDPADILPDC